MAGLTKVKGSGLATGAATDSLVGIDDNATSTAITIDSAERVGLGTDNMQMYNVGGGNSTLVVTAISSATNVLANTDSNITIANGDGTADNTAALHFAREDTDGAPNYVGASVVSQFKETQVTGQYPKADLAFLTSTATNTAPSEKMRIDSAGNVGVGTTSAFGKASINSNGAPATSGNMSTGLTVHNTSGGTAINIGTYDAGGYSYIQSAYVNSAGTTRDLAFLTGATERMRITSDGRGLSQFTAKAWVNFYGQGTVAIRESHNVSSVTDNDVGRYTVNFSNALGNSNYSATISAQRYDSNDDGNVPLFGEHKGTNRTRSTTTFPIQVANWQVGGSTGGGYDASTVNLIIFGD